MKTSASKILHIVGILLAAIAVQVFLTLCLSFFRGKWAPWLYYLVLIGGSLLNLGLMIADAVCCFWEKDAFCRYAVVAYFLLVLAAVVLFVLLKTGFLEIAKDEEALKAYLERTGGWMSALFVLLQFLQVVILPIPSTVTVVVGAALFGPLKGSLLSLLGIVLGSLCAFLIGRYAGSRVVAWLIGKDTLDKWLKKIKGKDKLLLSAMFLLPVFPDDVLCFVAGVSSMSVWLFLVIIVCSRVLAIFTTSYSIAVIPFTTWWGILIWIAFGALVIALFTVLYKKSDAILEWFARKFHRETRIEQKREKGEFTLEVVDPDGSLVTKGVERKDRTK